MNNLNEDFFINIINDKDRIFFDTIKSVSKDIIFYKSEIKKLEMIIRDKDKEIEFINSSKFWKLREIYLKTKHWLIFIFLNPRKFIKKYLNI